MVNELVKAVMEGEDPKKALRRLQMARQRAPRQYTPPPPAPTMDCHEWDEWGWEHFLSTYDGQSNELPSGAVWVRNN